MIINPRRAIEEGWIRVREEDIESLGYPPFNPEKQTQQNGIDLRLTQVNTILSESAFKISGSLNEYLAESLGSFYLQRLVPYELWMVEFVEVPKDVCAIIKVRSTFNRKGCSMHAGLYDSGFQNYVEVVAYPFQDVVIPRFERVCQIIFMEAESASLYNGQYQFKGEK